MRQIWLKQGRGPEDHLSASPLHPEVAPGSQPRAPSTQPGAHEAHVPCLGFYHINLLRGPMPEVQVLYPCALCPPGNLWAVGQPFWVFCKQGTSGRQRGSHPSPPACPTHTLSFVVSNKWMLSNRPANLPIYTDEQDQRKEAVGDPALDLDSGQDNMGIM